MLSNLTCRGFMGPCEKHGLLFFSFLVKSEEHGFATSRWRIVFAGISKQSVLVWLLFVLVGFGGMLHHTCEAVTVTYWEGNRCAHIHKISTRYQLERIIKKSQ
jgi:hypothetical protein